MPFSLYARSPLHLAFLALRVVMIGRRPVVLLGGVAFAAAAAAGCARTEPQSASSIAQVRQVAYLKAANPDMGDHFACGGSLPGHIGNAVAISADGNTIVVGAPHESSAARGINGNAADNSLYASGAVYVFVRRGDAWVQQAYVKASNAGQSDLFGMNVAAERRRQHDGRLRPMGAQRRHRHQRRPERRFAASGRRGVRLYAFRGLLVAAGLRQGVEHRTPRR